MYQRTHTLSIIYSLCSGNVQYRRLVKAYRGLYVQSTRRTKPQIAQCIVYSVRQVGGRFLKRVETDGEKDSDEGYLSTHNAAWVDVGNVKAREKTSQALREGAPDLRSVSSSGSTPGQHDSPPSPSAVSSSVVSASGGLESSSPSFVPGSSAVALSGYGSAVQSHIAAPTAVGSGSSFQAAAAAPHEKTSIPGGHWLSNHPLFHSLSPMQQHQLMMEELHAAREAAAAAEFAALRRYQYQRGLQEQLGHVGKMLPGHSHSPSGEYELGSVVGDRAFHQSSQQMPLDPKQQLALNGGGGGSFHLEEAQLRENQVKRRHADTMIPSLSTSLAEKGSGDRDETTNTTSRGPRLKRLKQRRQLEA